jgi:hypothetical protein
MLTHTGEQSHICSVCNKRFGRAQYLQRHMLTHMNRYSHTCTLCNAHFEHGEALTDHMQTSHPTSYQFNTTLTTLRNDAVASFPDFSDAHHYGSGLFSEPVPVNIYQRCPHCGENVADLEQHTAICPWRQGPSWQ